MMASGVFSSLTCLALVHSGLATLTQFHKQLVNGLNNVGLELGIMEAEILAQAPRCQELVERLLLIALVAAPTESTGATRTKEGGGGEEARPHAGGKGSVQRAPLGRAGSAGRGSDLPYSSRMIRSTLRTMLPTVVSEGCAAVILRPSLRIRSISSSAVRRGRVRRCGAPAGATFRLGRGTPERPRHPVEVGAPHPRYSSGGP